MTGILTLYGMLAVTCLFGKAFDKKPEEYFCVSIFTVIAVLFPFYCLDMLRLGRYAVYGLFAGIAALSVFRIIKKTEGSWKKSVKTMIPSPGICILAILVFVYVLFLHNSQVELWDELRLWGAAPKALYATEKLQLGKKALIFPSMQSYPPAMPLFAYFVTALAPNFPEYQIFVSYAVFFSSLILPVLRDLKWKQWPLFVMIGVFFIWAPCVFTSHDYDFSRFYNSLFIDPVLGALAGYAFYLSANRPFDGKTSSYRFGSALLCLTLLKDSGAMFAAFAGINAVTLFALECPKCMHAKRIATRVSLSYLPSAAAFAIWKYLLSYYSVATDSSSHLNLSNLSLNMLVTSAKSLLVEPMLVLEGLTFSLKLTFLPSLIVVLCISQLAIKNAEDKKNTVRITWYMIIVVMILFMIGNGVSFGDSLPSFARYVSTLLSCAFVFTLLISIPIVLQNLDYSQRQVQREERSQSKVAYSNIKRTVTMFVASVLVLVASIPFFADWKKQNKVINEYDLGEIGSTVYQIKQNEMKYPNQDSNYYLLISDDMVGNSRIHHRTYFELLTTSAHVRNFYNDTNVIGGSNTPEKWSDTDITYAAERWSEKLIEEEYDYIQVIHKNAFTAAVMECLGAEEIQNGETYAVDKHNGSVILRRCE